MTTDFKGIATGRFVSGFTDDLMQGLSAPTRRQVARAATLVPASGTAPATSSTPDTVSIVKASPRRVISGNSGRVGGSAGRDIAAMTASLRKAGQPKPLTADEVRSYGAAIVAATAERSALGVGMLRAATGSAFEGVDQLPNGIIDNPATRGA